MQFPRKGKLSSGKEYAVVLSGKAALKEEEGVHIVVLVPEDIEKLGPSDKALRKDQLTDEDRAELELVADDLGEEIAKELGNEGCYRKETNGPKAATRDHFHIHVLAWKKDVTVRRCVDRIVVDAPVV